MGFPRSGRIWEKPPRQRAQTGRRVCERIENEYGRPRFGNPTNPVDDLVYVVLSNKTGPQASRQTFQNLKGKFADWNGLIEARLSHVRRILKRAGLADVKSRQLRSALGKIRRDFGECSLKPLRRLSAEAAQAYLTGLRGVSEKVAKCIMMYTLGFAVLPVDSHVHRVATRLGWTNRKRADQCHDELEALVKPHFRFAFHVGCIVHGRKVCRPQNPRCDECIIRRHCQFGNRQTP